MNTAILTIPDTPGVYLPNTNCMFEFKIPVGHYLQIIYKYIHLEWYGHNQRLVQHYYGQWCPYDYIHVYNHVNLPESIAGHLFFDEKKIGKRIASLCHGDAPGYNVIYNNTMSVWSRTGSVLVRFNSDKDTEASGVVMQFNFLPIPAEDHARLAYKYDYPEIIDTARIPGASGMLIKDKNQLNLTFLYPMVIADFMLHHGRAHKTG